MVSRAYLHRDWTGYWTVGAILSTLTAAKCFRSLRGPKDYSAIILLDSRYAEERYTTRLPPWAQSDMKRYRSADEMTTDMSAFFAGFDSTSASVVVAPVPSGTQLARRQFCANFRQPPAVPPKKPRVARPVDPWLSKYMLPSQEREKRIRLGVPMKDVA